MQLTNILTNDYNKSDQIFQFSFLHYFNVTWRWKNDWIIYFDFLTPYCRVDLISSFTRYRPPNCTWNFYWIWFLTPIFCLNGINSDSIYFHFHGAYSLPNWVFVSFSSKLSIHFLLFQIEYSFPSLPNWVFISFSSKLSIRFLLFQIEYSFLSLPNWVFVSFSSKLSIRFLLLCFVANHVS